MKNKMFSIYACSFVDFSSIHAAVKHSLLIIFNMV